jgi:hypothetical protein
VQEFLTGAEKVAFIDWHTGIGDYGKPFFLCFNDAGSELFQRACEWWGKENVDGVRPHGMERPNYTGLVFNGVQRFPRQSRDVRRGDRVRHTRHRHAPRAAPRPVAAPPGQALDADVRASLQADMMDAFCPFDWPVAQGHTRFGPEADRPGNQGACRMVTIGKTTFDNQGDALSRDRAV